MRYPDECGTCHKRATDKGRAFDGRRAYRCRICGAIWTFGLQGRRRRYSKQRMGYQFANTNAGA